MNICILQQQLINSSIYICIGMYNTYSLQLTLKHSNLKQFSFAVTIALLNFRYQPKLYSLKRCDAFIFLDNFKYKI